MIEDQNEKELNLEVERLEKVKSQMQSEEKDFWRDVNNYERNLTHF